VIAPEPGGLTYFQAIQIIDGVANRRIAGFDVVEFVPGPDVNGINVDDVSLTASDVGIAASEGGDAIKLSGRDDDSRRIDSLVSRHLLRR
jgi:hypothetical protein